MRIQNPRVFHLIQKLADNLKLSFIQKTMLEQCCNYSKQCRAKNRRCE